MKRVAICASVLATLMAPAMAQVPGAWRTATEFPACRDSDDMKKIVGFLESGDSVAFAKFVNERTNSCVVLKAGVTVFIEKTGDGLSCARPKGEIDCVWLPGRFLVGE